ncbi:NADH dehydrogenase [ubiquinone] 1 beta subcomplex subunit 7 [Galleria mellonella]|uniref:NADH dehydrogenase [ubiquinone] 1 beta subcomplex subunit 7 n=1 Tax=Galleria mellonella TaxID=7137 RepID=A0A6J1WJD4_GALME|nr:NADH dehydrogenase [ubiquinone] 1 beta subcomplex subunit 7 [Galleria mellonella]XP_052753651.1 NADH dehydrogenase [ubiquinone] 1 beta subcomplex subunit 7 [Galleria mellonella]
MGQMMGSFNARNVDLYMDDKPTFDHQAGFNYERKQREMVAKEEDLISARIPPANRDYCAHYLLEYHQCRYKNMPLLYKCAHEKHHYLNCQHQDYVLRMKEFERERRLRLREQRLVGVA